VTIAVIQLIVFVAIYEFFVLTARGQALDTVALASNELGSERLATPINAVLNAISVAAVVVAMIVVGFIALVRRRVALAVTSVVLIAGANLTAELLKHYLNRPDLGIDPERAGAGNSFPSGHTAIAASVAVAFVLVLPPKARGAGAVIGTFYAALVGVFTMSAGWHRPSDAVGALLIVGVWAALAGILLRVLRKRGDRVVDMESHKIAGISLAMIGLICLGGAIVGLNITDDTANQLMAANLSLEHDIGGHRMLAAYLGSTAGILATASLVMALILLTIHRVVPRRPGAP
jgi:membrane-associated phospholipid phosphatase